MRYFQNGIIYIVFVLGIKNTCFLIIIFNWLDQNRIEYLVFTSHIINKKIIGESIST